MGVNIKTSKNVFEALGDEGEDSDGPSRPKEIRAAMVQKKKGEFAKTAVQNAVNKAKQDNKKSKRAEDEEDDEEKQAAASAAAAAKAEAAEARKKEKDAK